MKAAPGTVGQIVVQKFGGSSLATPPLRELAAQRVIEAIEAGRRPVVVTSAIGRHPDPYATDTLIELAPSPRHSPNVDLLLACGELISAAAFAELLEVRGIRACALSGGQAGIRTDNRFGEARIIRIDPQTIRRLLDAGITPVVAGFQGQTEIGEVTTIGRGGSDLSAVALAGALGDARCEIFTDVEGVMTADPRRVATAHTVASMSFEELAELAEHGANVMNDKAARLAHDAKTPYAVRGLHSGAGTAISDDAVAQNHPVTGVASKAGYTFIHVVPEAAGMPGGWEHDVFRVLADADISIDCINVNAAGVFFIVADERVARARQLLEALPVAVRARRDCAKISVVGAGMRGTPGVMYAVVHALHRAGIPIIHSTDSHITISVLVPAAQASAAESALHQHFGLAQR